MAGKLLECRYEYANIPWFKEDILLLLLQLNCNLIFTIILYSQDWVWMWFWRWSNFDNFWLFFVKNSGLLTIVQYMYIFYDDVEQVEAIIVI